MPRQRASAWRVTLPSLALADSRSCPPNLLTYGSFTKGLMPRDLLLSCAIYLPFSLGRFDNRDFSPSTCIMGPSAQDCKHLLISGVFSGGYMHLRYRVTLREEFLNSESPFLTRGSSQSSSRWFSNQMTTVSLLGFTSVELEWYFCTMHKCGR